MDKTKEILARMLTENTGTHFLDSGGTNGRMWQRNQGKDFEKAPASTVEFRAYDRDVYAGKRYCPACGEFPHHNAYAEVACPSCGKTDNKPVREERRKLEVSVTHNVYHWLAEKLTFDEDLDRKFHRWVRRQSADRYWLDLMQDWAEKMVEKYDGGHGPYGEGGEPCVVNTYNGEDALSQTLQYVYFETSEHGGVVMLQVHGGADVRGGYTKPRIFTTNDELGIFDNARASIWCPECEFHWDADDACNFAPEGTYGGGRVNLEDMDAVVFDGDPSLVRCSKDSVPHEKHTHDNADPLCNFPEQFAGKPEHYWEEGKVVVFDNKALCPKCGKGELEGGFY